MNFSYTNEQIKNLKNFLFSSLQSSPITMSNQKAIKFLHTHEFVEAAVAARYCK